MKKRSVLSIFLAFSLTGCGAFSSSGPASEYAVGGLVGTAAGAGIGAAIGSVIDNGDVANSTLLGAGVGLAVGTVGMYAYKEIKTHNQLIDNQDQIEENRLEILSRQSELDEMRERALTDSHSIDFDETKTEQVYDGATLGVYYR